MPSCKGDDSQHGCQLIFVDTLLALQLTWLKQRGACRTWSSFDVPGTEAIPAFGTVKAVLCAQHDLDAILIEQALKFKLPFVHQ